MELLRVAFLAVLALAALYGCLRHARDGEKSGWTRVPAALGAILLAGGFAAAGLVVGWILLAASEAEDPPDGPFQLRGQFVGSSAFDDVERCPIEFPELENLERCLGQRRGFQDPSWWIAATGTPGGPLPGERVPCGSIGLSSYRECWRERHEPDPPSTDARDYRTRIAARRPERPGAAPVLVIEIVGGQTGRALAEALERLRAERAETGPTG